MPNAPQKLILIGAGRYDYAEIELSGSLQIVGPNNTGKTTLINTLQFLYIDDRRQMDFGSYTPEQTRDYYFPNQYSYILFECLGVRGKFVLGWRGQSKAAGGEPERFAYEGPFSMEDFLEENGRVREPRAVSANLSFKQYSVLKTAQEHRELLLQATKGEGRGAGLVMLRDNDKYPHFRETLKDLLSLSTITQDRMRDRLLMLAGLPTEKFALDIRELFGEDYERILRLKQKLVRFKKHQRQIELLVQTCAARGALRNELLYRWTDLRGQRQEFERAHDARIAALSQQIEAENGKIRLLQNELNDRRAEKNSFAEFKGGLQVQLRQIAAQANEFKDFIEDFERAALNNAQDEQRRLELQLAEAEKETRDNAERKLELYRSLVAQKQRTLAHFDRALVTVLRGDLRDEELAPLARLFNFDLLEQPVGPGGEGGGVRVRRHEEFVHALRLLSQRVEGAIYRDENVELSLPPARHSLSEFENLDSVRARLAEEEQTLARWQGIFEAIVQRESLVKSLRQKREEAERLNKRIVLYEQFQKQKAEEPRLLAELKRTSEALQSADERIAKLDSQIEAARQGVKLAENGKVTEENAFNEVMGRFNLCIFPEFPGKPEAPAEAVPGDFDAAVSIFLRQQKKLGELEQKAREGFLGIEAVLGSDFTAADDAETLRLLREELEALPEREEALRRDWDHQLHQLRATFDQVLRGLGDIKSAADRLNRQLSGVQVSNLTALRMDVVEQADVVNSLRKLSNVEQPGLFDDSSSLEAALGAFRLKFEANPLLRYTDLFTLRFTVTADDGRPHHYNDFRQVESHGTTITIKVLFNLLVLRSLLREDANKALLCEVPFFLDEIHSLDPTNRHAVLVTARKLGFIAITAAPESVSEVDALYFLQPQNGRIVLRQRHRVSVKTRSHP